MRRALGLAAVVVVAVSHAAACSGGDDGPACGAPIALAQGTWCVTISASQNTCARPRPAPYPAEFTQTGSTLTGTSSGTTYSGTLCGSEATMSGYVPGITLSVEITFSDATHASGATTWSSSTCSGVDTFTAVAGACN